MIIRSASGGLRRSVAEVVRLALGPVSRAGVLCHDRVTDRARMGRDDSSKMVGPGRCDVLRGDGGLACEPVLSRMDRRLVDGSPAARSRSCRSRCCPSAALLAGDSQPVARVATIAAVVLALAGGMIVLLFRGWADGFRKTSPILCFRPSRRSGQGRIRYPAGGSKKGLHDLASLAGSGWLAGLSPRWQISQFVPLVLARSRPSPACGVLAALDPISTCRDDRGMRSAGGRGSTL